MTITFCALCVCAGMQDLQYTFNVPTLRAKSFAGAALISLVRLAAPGQASPVSATAPASAAAVGLGRRHVTGGAGAAASDFEYNRGCSRMTAGACEVGS